MMVDVEHICLPNKHITVIFDKLAPIQAHANVKSHPKVTQKSP